MTKKEVRKLKKHIIIAGASRSGKTTLATRLKELGYIHYTMDSIKRGIYNNNFAKGRGSNWEEVSPKMAKILERLILDNKNDINYNVEFYSIDIGPLFPKDVIKLNKMDNVIVMFLGYPLVDASWKVEQMRKYDKLLNSWSRNFSEEELKIMVKFNIEFSKKVKQQCLDNNIMFFDTGYNQNEVLEKIYNKIVLMNGEVKND